MLSTLATCATLICASATPHPFHRSFAEVECKPEKRELQVSLAVLATDFEETLSRRAGKRVNLDRTKGIAKIIENYLAERFVVTLPDGTKPRPSFLGREDKKKIVWIYFTVPLARPAAASHAAKPGPKPATKKISKQGAKPKRAGSLLLGTKLQNRVLMELNEGQFNAVSLREGHWRRSMRFEKPDQVQVLRTKAKHRPTADRPAPRAKQTGAETPRPRQRKGSR